MAIGDYLLTEDVNVNLALFSKSDYTGKASHPFAERHTVPESQTNFSWVFLRSDLQTDSDPSGLVRQRMKDGQKERGRKSAIIK